VVCPEGSVCTSDGLGCRQTTDLCGNGDMDVGEACDDGNQIDEDNCRADCQLNICGDGKRDQQSDGAGDPTEECDEVGAADSATCDSDCTLPRCGDMHTNPMFTPVGAPRGERCDDGDNDSGDGCSADCASMETCGDSYINDDLPTTGAACLTATGSGTNCPELCDDGNQIAGDGCSPNCLSEEDCRNGILDAQGNGGSNPPELCDDGDTDDTDECRNNCQSGFGCGNGFVDNDGPTGTQFDEECDNGSTTDSDICDGDCTIPVCGDNRPNTAAGEICDPGSIGVNVASCNSDCTMPACGDGKVNRAFTPVGATGPEQCDDNNTTAGDGCSATCQIETCGNGVTESINGEQCDDGNLMDLDACRNTCQFPRCGDGVASASEACDTNGNSQTCNIDCSVPACGDGKVNRAFTPSGATGPEQCDDMNTTAGDGCSATCQIETCGNGVTETINGEQCDDGNLMDLDACRNTCQFPRCGDGVASASETCDTNGNSQTCNLDCSAPACGDGKLNPSFTPSGGPGPEQCDDNNTTSGDGCSNLCRVEPFALSVALAGTGAGSVASGPAGITCGADCTELFPTGTSVTLTATAGASSVFTGWSGAGCSGTGTCVVAMTAARNVVATFSLNTLTVVKAGNGLGEVTGTGISCGSTGVDCTENYNAATMVTLVATPGVNTSFTGWSGGGCSGTGSCVTTMNGATTITATFTFNSILLTVVPAGNGTGTVTSVPAGINCGVDCTEGYDANTVVTLTAAPTSNNTFTGWSGAGCTGTGTCTVTMSTARTVTATFTLNQHQLSVVRTGSGSGSVSSSPSGITCGVDCTENYNAGTVVTLTATAAGDSDFTGWSGGGCSGTGTCVVTVNAATSVTATFAIKTFVLSVSRTGTGTGTVTSVPSGINCGGTCVATYNAGTLVTLTAVPGGNSAFTGWSGGGCSGLLACTVTMSAAQSVQANFDTDVRVLTVDHAGTGTGTVTSSPAGITACTASSGTCAAPFAQGSMVTLTATATADSTFTSWSGGGCSGSGSCVVTMNNAATVTATFTLRTFTLTVTSTGGGTLTSVPAGIACPGTCMQTYSSGQVVGLVAVASATTTFSGWTGACSATVGTICYLTITANTTAGATFTAAQRTLTVTRAGGGGGAVTSSPVGITCDVGTNDCTQDYAHGTAVTLTATADAGSTFTGWAGGGCSGTGTCMVPMTSAQNVTATFALQSFVLTVNKAGTGAGAVTSVPSGINCTGAGPCTASYTSGSLVQLTATPNAGSSFAGWTGACAGTGTCLVTMSAAQSVTATFTLNTFLLTANVTQSAGQGSVTASPAGTGGITACIAAGCTSTYNFNTSVTLTASLGTATGVTWTGCDSTPTATTCVVLMTAVHTVDATFTGP
jgi:cysteine-rich repeat protein